MPPPPAVATQSAPPPLPLPTKAAAAQHAALTEMLLSDAAYYPAPNQVTVLALYQEEADRLFARRDPALFKLADRIIATMNQWDREAKSGAAK